MFLLQRGYPSDLHRYLGSSWSGFVPMNQGGYTRVLRVQDAVHFALKRAGFKIPGNSKFARQC